MIGINRDSLPFESKVNFRMLKYLRMTRNLTQEKFGEICKIDQSVLARLESGEIELSINYESKVLEGCKTLSISENELDAIRTLLMLKNNEGEK